MPKSPTREHEEPLFKALSLGNDKTRTINMFALGQTFARQGTHKIPSAVACFANAYRFFADSEKTRDFLRDLASNDDNAYVRVAAEQALRLKLVRG